MALLGRALLILALATALYGVGASVYGARGGGVRWVASGRRAVFVLAGLLIAAFAILEAAFLRSDFSFDLVASYSSTTTPTFYKATAVWSSQAGSLLLWVMLLSIWSSLALLAVRHKLRDVQPWATAVLLLLASFFLGLLVIAPDARPFVQLAQAPVEGNGLNPLLRHPAMMIHPPMLYSGYTLSAVPFAFALGALASRRVGGEWLKAVRRFALAGWLFLGVGILLGARWSYTELGWGGYWGWDAVENASLLPWLTGTAFLHSAMIGERRGMLKVWNVALVLGTGVLAVLGTFLVRSGIIDSIHAFGASTVGGPFLVLVATMTAVSVGLVIWRRDLLRSEHTLDSLVSREAIFLLQNVLLVGLAFAIALGTFFPLLSEALTGTRRSLGPPWFDDYTVPFALVLVLLTGVGPLIAWRRATPRNLSATFARPALVGVALLAVLAALGAADHLRAWLMFGLAGFAVACVGQELVRGVSARRAMTGELAPRAFVSLVSRNRRRYGGYLAHVGVAVLLVGVAASSSFKHTTDVSLKPGGTARVADYTIRYVRPTTDFSSEKISFGAVLDVSRDGRHFATLKTTRGYYPSKDLSLGVIGRFFGGEPTSEVALKSSARRDFWAVIAPNLIPLRAQIDDGNRRFLKAMRAAGTTPDPRAQLGRLFALRDEAIRGLAERWVRAPWAADFRFISSPMVAWIWIGGIIVAGGGLTALWPAPQASRRRAVYLARVGREVAERV